MSDMGVLWVLALTMVAGAAAIMVALVPGLKSSPHAPALMQMFSKSWIMGFGTLIGLLVGIGTR